MKSKSLLLFVCLTMSASCFSQNIGIGKTVPAYKLDVAGTIRTDSNLLVNDSVGIGTITPAYKLDVNSTINASANGYFGGYIGIGTQASIYKLTVQDGSVALHNSTDNKYWIMTYNNGGDYMSLAEDGATRLAIANGSNVGIGTTAPSAKLDVVGTAELNGDVTVTGTEHVSGSLTVNNNKGVVYNLSGSTNIKYYTRSAAFTVSNRAAHSLSAEGSIGFIGGFSSAP